MPDGIGDGIGSKPTRIPSKWCYVSDFIGDKSRPRKPKPYKMVDGGGLYLVVTPTNSKLWRMNYRHGGKRKTWAVGAFPAVDAPAR
jgi:hypothetical protein